MKNAVAIIAVLAIAGCSAVHSRAQQADENKAVVQKFIDRMNQHDAGVVDEYVDPGFVEHNPAPGTEATREGLKKMFVESFKGFPDMKASLEHIVAEGDLVAIHLLTTGTNKGPMMGMPATGKAIKIQEVHILRMAHGKVVEHWGVEDNLAMMQQLGLMPEPGKK